jgi:hypothetical protein
MEMVLFYGVRDGIAVWWGRIIGVIVGGVNVILLGFVGFGLGGVIINEVFGCVEWVRVRYLQGNELLSLVINIRERFCIGVKFNWQFMRWYVIFMFGVYVIDFEGLIFRYLLNFELRRGH